VDLIVPSTAGAFFIFTKSCSQPAGPTSDLLHLRNRKGLSHISNCGFTILCSKPRDEFPDVDSTSQSRRAWYRLSTRLRNKFCRRSKSLLSVSSVPMRVQRFLPLTSPGESETPCRRKKNRHPERWRERSQLLSSWARCLAMRASESFAHFVSRQRPLSDSWLKKW
jgi:hypothetical protein